jgi:chemotaxis protein MotA
MNIASIVGFIIALAVLIFGLLLATNDINIFVDYPSMFIVIGGTFAATAISFQIDKIGVLLKVFFARIIQGKKVKYEDIIANLMGIAEGYRKGEKLLDLANSQKDPFLQEALILAGEEVIKGEELIEVLKDRAKNMHFYYMEETQKFKSMGKFPPAFGMMGTTIGMIVLLGNLGGADAIKMIGPAMGVCLITTLYGVIIANLAVLPIAENLFASTKEAYLKNQIIVEGIRLIMNKTNPIVVAERLNSFLPPSKRLDWKDVVNG